MTHSGWVTLSQNFRFWSAGGLQIWWEMVMEEINDLLNQTGVCRTAPATLGQLKKIS